MFWYTIRRLIGAVGLLFVMSVVVFLLFYATPTDPARLTCGKNCTPTGIEANRKYLGLDQSITQQYLNFVGGLFHDRKFPADEELQKARPDLVITCEAPCLGYTSYHNEEVWTYLKPKVPVTMSIVIVGFIMWLVSGVLLGIVAALFRGRSLDRLLVSGSLIFYSFPTFFVSLLLLQLIVYQFGWMQTPVYTPISASVGDWLYNLFLPSATLALVFAAAYIRLTRAYMLETMGEDYLRTARAKGVRERKVVFKHTLRAALTPIVTIAGLDFGLLLAGAPITETVFSFQGLGYATVQSVTIFDLPVTVVIVLLGACFVIVANLAVDLLYGVIDPRVRY
jgi:peptide/nickel transport system permease protein